MEGSMKKIILQIALGLAVILAVILIYASTKPNVFRVERSLQIHAAPESIAVYVADFHKWAEWSPWEKLDPAMKRTFSGSTSGKGAVYEWNGNDKVGSGRMEILDVVASKIIIKLDFITPFEGHNTTEVRFNSENGSTTLTWAMYGPSRYLSKVLGIFFNMDKIIGKDFETGLQNLKSVTEK
jgi:hypothetical protein